MKKTILLLLMTFMGLVGTYAWAGSAREDTVDRLQTSVDVLHAVMSTPDKDQLLNSSEKRLAPTLLLLAHFGKEGKRESVVPKISHEMPAEMIGTTRSRVSSFMNRFRELGLMHYNGGLQVHTSLLNVVLHD
jgi:CRP-like cAMP-binding protein